MHKKIVTCVIISTLVLLTACGDKGNLNTNNIENTVVDVDSIENSNEEPEEAEDIEEVAYERYVLQEIPVYDGNSYVELNGNIPSFSDYEKSLTDSFEFYSALDALGRCGTAYANISIETMPTEERGNIGNVKPSGWQLVKYNDLIDGNYLYNRCHLIGFQLAGENDNVLNLITGTRYLNVIGMLEFENLVSEYVVETGNHVLYRVTPIFENDNLVASGVQMEAWSVEDEGKGICFNVFCFNVQPGIEIDYLTGESWISGEEHPEESNEDDSEELGEDSSEVSGDEVIADEYEYVLNVSSHKIHLPTCQGVKDMAEHNKEYYSGDVSVLLTEGYTYCQGCLGDR